MEELDRAFQLLMTTIQAEIAAGYVMSQQEENILANLIKEHTAIMMSQHENQQIQLADTQEAASLIWILAGGNQQAFLSYLETFPDPALNALLRNQNQLQQVIQSLSQRFPEGIDLQADGIPHADLMSSNVYGYRYNPGKRELLVRFNNGGVYRYSGVPKQIYQMFANGAIPAKTDGQNQYGRWWKGKSPSLGSSFFSLIKMGGYPYQKLK
jgi:hypothetical protein